MPRRATIEEFTDAFLRKAAPGEYTERLRRGFSVRITETADGRRMVRFSLRYVAPGGQQRRLRLGEMPSTTLAKAHREADDVLGDVRRQKDPQGDRAHAALTARQQLVRTIGDLWADYEEHQQTRVKASTLGHARDLYERHLKKPWGGLGVRDVTKAHARALLNGLERRKLKTTRNRVRGLIVALFRHADDELGMAVANPVKGIKPLKEQPRHRVLTDDELRQIWRRLDGAADDPAAPSLPVALAIMLATVTLQRRAEVARIDQCELQLGGAAPVWMLPGGDRTKNSKPHAVPLSPLAVRLIKSAQTLNGGPAAAGPLFRAPKGKGEALRPEALSLAFRRLTRRLKIADADLHDLRRTGATILASERLGVSRYIVNRVLNHSDAGGGAAITTQVYAVGDDMPRKRQALEAWAALLEEIVSEKERPSNVVELRA